jgi:hypothetical protein
MISGFGREEDVDCALLGYQAASSGNSLPTYRSKRQGSRILTPKDGTDTLSRNVGKKLPLLAA